MVGMLPARSRVRRKEGKIKLSMLWSSLLAIRVPLGVNAKSKIAKGDRGREVQTIKTLP